MNLGPTTRQSKRIKIKALWERGDSQRQIAKAVGCNLTTVERWISRFKDTEEDSVPENVAVLDQPRSGAPPKITKSIGKAILKFTEVKTGRQAPVIKSHVYKKFGVTLTVQHIRLWLKAEGLHPYHRPKCLALSDSQKEKRVKFALRYKATTG